MESGPQKNHVLGSAVCAVASGQFALPDERQKSHLISLSVTIGAYFAEMSMGGAGDPDEQYDWTL